MYLDCPLPRRLRRPAEKIVRDLPRLIQPMERLDVQPGQPEISIVAGGDLAMGGMTSFQCREVLGDLRPFWDSADLRLANLEAQVTSRRHRAIAGNGMRAPVESLQFVNEARIDAVTVANNHALDYGSEGLAECCERLKSAGVAVSGCVQEGAEAPPVIVEKRGVRVGMLAWCDLYRPPLEEPVTICPALMPAPEVMTAAIERLRRSVDIVVVQMHWGYEFSLHPLLRHRDLARKLADAGAQIVLCHHAHVPMAVEAHGRSIIAHGLGNWLMLNGRYLRENHDWTSRSFLIKVNVSRSGVHSAELEPFDLFESVTVRRLTGGTRQRFLSAIGKVSRRIHDTEWLQRSASTRTIFETVWMAELLVKADPQLLRERAWIFAMPVNQELIAHLRSLQIEAATRLAGWFEALASARFDDRALQEAWECERPRALSLTRELRARHNWLDVFRSRIP